MNRHHDFGLEETLLLLALLNSWDTDTSHLEWHRIRSIQLFVTDFWRSSQMIFDVPTGRTCPGSGEGCTAVTLELSRRNDR
jgi:hypothetical protein